jgi:serine protease AprX
MHKLSNLFTIIASPFVILVLFIHVVHSAQAEVWMQKVDTWVQETSALGAETEFLVYLEEQADLSQATHLQSRLERGQFVYESLGAVARRTQTAVIASLEARGVDYQPFWVANMIWVRADANTVEAMARRRDVAHIYGNPAVLLDKAKTDEAERLALRALAVEWNIERVNAPDVWAAGFTGQGVVIGGQDTGYDWDHPALINQYRGWDGITVDHNYNWHDAIRENNPNSAPGNPCGFATLVPCDDNSHGTHTMGTMVGDDGDGRQIGMAPGATWIGCRNMEQGWGTPASYAECYQWFIAPTDLGDANADPAKAPHVINNSWSCPTSEGCNEPEVLQAVVDNVRAAGIVTVHAAGNSGYYQGCGTIDTPAAIYDASFTVGATSSSDGIASFSSRGPVTIDGSNRLKPDVSAPGVNINSAIPGTGYGIKQGTSMAGPHVAGLVALLISAEPGLAGNVDAIENLIQQTAAPVATVECGGGGPAAVPNNVYGFGRIDAWAAYQAVSHGLEISKSAAEIIGPGEIITYTLSLTHNHFLSATRNVTLSDALPAATTFVTATIPHVFDGDTITWTLDQLAANAGWQVVLAVQAPITENLVISNDRYGAASDEVPEPVSGLPVTTTVRRAHVFYFPIFSSR